ncbi:MAG: hypothetical protein Q8T09_11480 [Candidatus Melainabacteria bacterium]|nr:hypothetical protein [Candidatus Melainabacteria bacterium]
MTNSKTKTPKITVDPRGCLFIVLSTGETVPLNFTNLVALPGFAREVVRIAGGCKGLSAEFQANLLTYFVEAFKVVDEQGNTMRPFTGTAFSGGTANVDEDGRIKDDMVTNVPSALAAVYPCLAMSSTPRTADMALSHESGGLIIDAYGGRIDYRQQAALVVQQNASDVLDWDGDLEVYLTLLEGWQMVGFKTAIIAMNGGKVTRDEIYGALKKCIPVIVVRDSGREADAFIQAFENGDFTATAAEERAKLASKSKNEAPVNAIVNECKLALESVDRSLVTIVPLGDSKALREALLARGFMSGTSGT